MGLRSCFYRALPAALALALAACSIYDTSLLLDAPPGAGGAGGSAGGQGGAGSAGEGGAGQGGEDPGGAGGSEAGSGGEAGSGEGGAGAGQGGAGAGQGGGGQGGGPACVGDGSCDDKNPCTADACVAGKCENKSNDTLKPPQSPNDCRAEKCSGGKVVVSNDDADLPKDDSNPCTSEVCESGVPNYDPVADDKPCQISGKSGVCKGGKCQVECSGDGECNDSNPCTADTCASGKCLFTPLGDGAATPGATDTKGDCKKSVCKGGVAVDDPDLADVPAAADECKVPKCTDAGPGADPKPDNTPCGAPGSVCAGGACVKPTCGDGVRLGAEKCDGADLNGKTCADFGAFGPGSTGLVCSDDCDFDATQCKGKCGNGVVEPGEDCDDAVSPGAAGDGCSAVCKAEPKAGELVITEILLNPELVAADEGEWFELLNTSATSYDLRGLKIVSNGTEAHVIDSPTPVVVAPGQYFLLAKSADMAKNGGLTPGYTYGTKITFSNSSDDFIQLEVTAASPLVIDKASWTGSISGSTKYKGASFSLSAAKLNATDNDDTANWCPAKATFASSTDKGTPGAPNDGCP